ncbi:MAG: hypothetical protein AVO39_02860 [delta proteobacterium MLS_D]|jgi:hypothetical protein|nr:MAG: hypothetical protein AVO39_02860 [delta proteobacterium MLS_D]
MKTILAGCIAALMLFAGLPAAAQEAENKDTEKGGFLQTLTDVLGKAAEEGLEQAMDEWLGTYKGHIGRVEVAERRGNALVLDVTYENVKRADGVYVDGRILEWGIPLDSFETSLNPIQGASGKARLTIRKKKSEWGSDWDDSEEVVESDQVELFLVREGHEDRPFGKLVYDLVKTWNDSDAPDQPPAMDEEEAVALADDEERETTPLPGVFIPAGTVLQARGKIEGKAEQSDDSSETDEESVPVANSYDFFKNVGAAQWKSGSPDGKTLRLSYPGRVSDKQGYVMTAASAKVNPDIGVESLLRTHPRKRQGGWIRGAYPKMILDESVHFRATAAFIRGADDSDGATFKVWAREGGEYVTLFSKHVSPEEPVSIDVDLSPWAGKEVSIILGIAAGETATHDWTVWVKPRLEQVDTKEKAGGIKGFKGVIQKR